MKEIFNKNVSFNKNINLTFIKQKWSQFKKRYNCFILTKKLEVN